MTTNPTTFRQRVLRGDVLLGAFLDNPASSRVSQAIGYEPNGIDRLAPRGVPRELRRYRLTLEGWRSKPRPAVEVEGLEGCLELFGVPA